MMGLNIPLHQEIRESIFELSSIPLLIWSSGTTALGISISGLNDLHVFVVTLFFISVCRQARQPFAEFLLYF